MVNIKVAVRIRPLSQREVTQKDESIVKSSDKSILVTNLKVPERQDGDSRQRIRRFAVDYCYDPKDPDSCTQERVYRDVGTEVLDSMFDGYNACVLAYGHSASGKTYTMMGEEDDPGLTPRICRGLFKRIEDTVLTARVRFQTVISFLEIYNERVRDLLVSDESGSNFSLRVREHPKLGPYVQDLSQHVVDDEDSILEYLSIGNGRRSTAATENNVHSSRSHAVFTIRFKQSDESDSRYDTDITSKVHLVDLAGSERAGSAQSKTRLKEGANINKSLVTLGNVISALAESCETFATPREQPPTKTWQPFVPYRDSVLTWLLKDTLGGNSNTIMIATVSPASSCLNETINTLRYAKRTKRIVNQPIVNEDPKIRTIRELREEIEKLRNVILSLQLNNRKYLEGDISTGDISKSTVEEDTADVVEEDPKFDESPESVVDVLGLVGLDILPDESLVVDRSLETSQTSQVNDENRTDVNDVGSVIDDSAARENRVLTEFRPASGPGKIVDAFSFPLPPLPPPGSAASNHSQETTSRKRRFRTHRDTQSVPKISRLSKSRLCPKRYNRSKTRVFLDRDFDSLESLSPKMLHRSRPDLIKGHSKDGLPSTSSQSFTDVSGLSQSASENSLHSSESETKSRRSWIERKPSADSGMKPESKPAPGGSRQSSLGDGSGSSTPTQIPKPVPKRRADKRSEIVAAVTTRLYATKKKPDPRMEAIQAAEKPDDDDDGELEELKLCKRARMKLFDLSRKLAMAKRVKKTADTDTQTDFVKSTIRMKEKSVVTDQKGVTICESSGTNTDGLPQRDEEQPIIMNHVFIPRSGKYILECVAGKSVRIQVPAPMHQDSGTQTVTTDRRDEATSPTTEAFSDDSLEDDDDVTDSLETKPMKTRGAKSRSNENVAKRKFRSGRSYDSLVDARSVHRSWFPITRYPIAGTNALYEYDPNKSNPDVVYTSSNVQNTDITFPLYNGLPTSLSTNHDHVFQFPPASDGNASSENSFDGSDVTSSSETSSEDFVFYEGPRTPTGLGNLYTISENSESSDLMSDPSSPPRSSLHVREAESEAGKEPGVRVSAPSPNVLEEESHAEGGTKEKATKKMNWSNLTSHSQRNFLNFKILGSSSRQTPFTVDSNTFAGDKKRQTSEGKFPSEDSITFVFMGPNRRKTSVLMEIITRSLRRNSSETALDDGTRRRSRNRNVRCELLRSVSVDTAMMALSKFAKNESSPTTQVPRTASLDALVSEDTRTILEKGLLHREELGAKSVVKYAASTSTVQDQGTETEAEKVDKSSMTSSPVVETSCEASEENLLCEFFPEVPRTRIGNQRWTTETGDAIPERIRYEEDEEGEDEMRKRRCKTKKSVSWSDLSDSSTEKLTDESTRRVRFTEPQDAIDGEDSVRTAADVTAFLKEAIRLLKSLNYLSQMYDGQEKSELPSITRVETSVQTDSPNVSLSADSSPVRRARSSSFRDRRSNLNLTWPRQRETNGAAVLGKPPTGIRYPSKPPRSPLPLRPQSSSSFDVLKTDVADTDSTGTNWNISNLSTTFSNSYVGGESVYSRPSSSKSFYSEKYWSPRVSSRLTTELDLEMDLEESCRRLELAVEQDRIRQENSSIKLTGRKYNCYDIGATTTMTTTTTTTTQDTSTRSKTFERKPNNGYVRRKLCKCYCHVRTTNRVYRSSLELEAPAPVERHCHACCTPCESVEPERSNSTPALNSICDTSDGNKCRLFYYGYCPCSSVKLHYVKSSPRAYMQHLLTLRRQIVKKTYEDT